MKQYYNHYEVNGANKDGPSEDSSKVENTNHWSTGEAGEGEDVSKPIKEASEDISELDRRGNKIRRQYYTVLQDFPLSKVQVPERRME